MVDAPARLRELEAELRRLTLEKDILKKSGGVLHAGVVVKYALIRDQLVGGFNGSRDPEEETPPRPALLRGRQGSCGKL